VFKDLADIFRLGALLVAAFGDPAVDGVRPKARFFRGVSEAICRTVETRCGGRGSGVPGLEGLLRRLIKPYLSTSLPLTSSQSSMPPASSCPLLAPPPLRLDSEDPGLWDVSWLKSPFDLRVLVLGTRSSVEGLTSLPPPPH
jgi:hypothetical protein